MHYKEAAHNKLYLIASGYPKTQHAEKNVMANCEGDDSVGYIHENKFHIII